MDHNAPAMESTQGLLSTAQAVEMLGVHANTIRNWADAGLLHAFRIGPRRDRRFLRADVNTFLKADTHAPSSS